MAERNSAIAASEASEQPAGFSTAWRAALLGTVAASALLCGYGRAARADCSSAGTTVTCTGDISGTVPPFISSGGISILDPYDTLNVTGLTADIAPDSGVHGIEFTVSGDQNLTLNSSTGPFRIVTTGANADGIHARRLSPDTRSLTVVSSGDITSGARGIYAENDLPSTLPVSVTSNGNVAAHSTGIYVRTIVSSVTIDNSGDVTSATGDAIYARNIEGAPALNVTLHSGTVHGAEDGVEFSGGHQNLLTNHASLSGGILAVRGGLRSETVDNFGTITGSIDLGADVNTFNNHAGGLFNSGATVNLGAGNLLTNSGDLSPGGVGAVRTTALTGNLVQTGTGRLTVDVGGGNADRIDITGTADLTGTVAINLLARPTVNQFTILTAAGGVDDLGLEVTSPALHAQLLFPDANTLALALAVDFTVDGLNRNERAIAAKLNAAFYVGGGGLEPLLTGLLNTPGLEAYKAALDQLLPEVYQDAQIAALYASLGFADSLLSCKVNGATTASIIHEGQCLWAGASATFLDQRSTFQLLGFSETAGQFAAGAQVAIAPEWRLGVGAGYQSSTLGTATNATSEGELGQAGAALKYNPGPLLLAGVVNGGRGWYDTTRPMAFGGFAGTAQSDTEIDIVNGAVRAAYVVGAPQLYLKPTLDAAATRLNLGGFTESGGGAANLVVQSNSQTVYTIAPSLEIGTEWWLANGTLVRPFLRAGATWYDNGDLALSASFLGAPPGVAPFTIETKIDEVMGLVSAGLDVINGEDTVLHLTYDGQFGNTTQIHAVALKGSARF